LKESGSKIRIKDIARLAGVSEGTVDRVLHNRGEVSDKSRDAVNQVLKEINYSPNLLARSLALKKQYNFSYLIPNYEKGDYWEAVEKGFKQAQSEFSQFNVKLTKYYFNQFDINSFFNTTNEIKSSLPDAVIISPIFRKETVEFIKELNTLKIPFSFIDSMIENTGFLTYYGQNSFLSGFIAAKLLFNSLSHHSQIIVIRTKRKGSVSNQTLSRKNGFMQYTDENNLADNKLLNVELEDDNDEKNIEILKSAFEKNTNISAAITFNSKVYRLAGYLNELGKGDIRLIGYDLTDKNIEYIKNDVVSYLIAQRPEKQAFLTVRDLCRELIFKQEIKNINYVPIDILMKENIDDYLSFQE